MGGSSTVPAPALPPCPSTAPLAGVGCGQGVQAGGVGWWRGVRAGVQDAGWGCWVQDGTWGCGLGVQQAGWGHGVRAGGAVCPPPPLCTAPCQLVGAGKGLPRLSPLPARGAPGRGPVPGPIPGHRPHQPSTVQGLCLIPAEPLCPQPGRLGPHHCRPLPRTSTRGTTVPLSEGPGLALSTPSTHRAPLQAPLWQLLCRQHHGTPFGTARHTVWHSMPFGTARCAISAPCPSLRAASPGCCLRGQGLAEALALPVPPPPPPPPALLPPCCASAKSQLQAQEDTCRWEAPGDTPAAPRHLRGRGTPDTLAPPPPPPRAQKRVLVSPGEPGMSLPALPCSAAAGACLNVPAALENGSAAPSPPGWPHHTGVPPAAPGGWVSHLPHPRHRRCPGSARP